MVLAYWHHSPPIRDGWTWLLVFAIPLYSGRWLIHRRLWSRTPLDVFMGLFLIASIFNYWVATSTPDLPYHRADYWVIICRPVLGMFIVIYFGEVARQKGSMEPILTMTVGLCLVIGLLGLTTPIWTEKSEFFQPIIDLIPRFDYKAVAPNMLLGFNVNEVAGGITWLCPLAAGLFFYPWRFKAMRWIAGFAFVCLLLALMFGQSRFAIAGAVVALAIIAWFCISHRFVRYLALAALGLLVIFEMLLLLNILPIAASPSAATGSTESSTTSSGLSERDETTFNTRFEIWESALRMMADYPLTGTGMAMFRTAVQREPYQVQHYVNIGGYPPHAHNEWVQFAADMGLPGLLIFVGWQIAALYMLVLTWRRGDNTLRVVAITAGAALLAHMVFGVGDAIPVWDRFHFIFWWVLGLAAGGYVIIKQQTNKKSPSTNP